MAVVFAFDGDEKGIFLSMRGKNYASTFGNLLVWIWYNAQHIVEIVEDGMSRVINPDGVGKERTRLSRATVLALRELMRQAKPDETSRDLAAFIALTLEAIAGTIDQSVTAWEKKGYWLKADRFRLEWDWSARLSQQMRKAVGENDWATIAVTAAQVGGKLAAVKLPERHRLGEPWVGAYRQMIGPKN